MQSWGLGINDQVLLFFSSLHFLYQSGINLIFQGGVEGSTLTPDINIISDTPDDEV